MCIFLLYDWTYHLNVAVCQSTITVLTLLQQKGACDGPENCFFSVSIKIIDSAFKSIALGMHTEVVHKEQYLPYVQSAVLQHWNTYVYQSVGGNVTRSSYYPCYNTCNIFQNKCKTCKDSLA